VASRFSRPRLIDADDKQYRTFLAQIMIGKDNQRPLYPPSERDLFGGEAEAALRDWLGQRYTLSNRRLVEYLEHRGRSAVKKYRELDAVVLHDAKTIQIFEIKASRKATSLRRAAQQLRDTRAILGMLFSRVYTTILLVDTGIPTAEEVAALMAGPEAPPVPPPTLDEVLATLPQVRQIATLDDHSPDPQVVDLLRFSVDDIIALAGAEHLHLNWEETDEEPLEEAEPAPRYAYSTEPPPADDDDDDGGALGAALRAGGERRWHGAGVTGQPADSPGPRDHAQPRPRQHAIPLSPTHLLTLALFFAFLLLYMRTAAPSVLSGDSAEFQFAAPLLGVPHPTTYPLYVLLGKLATLLGPAGDPARRVTLVSSGCAALAVALFFRLARRLSAAGPALLAALLFGFAPGLWNAATMAEVYALLMLLLVGLCCLLAPPPADRAAPAPLAPAAQSWWRPRAAALVAGLGFTHHGLFVIAGMPLFLGAIAWRAWQHTTADAAIDHRPGRAAQSGRRSPLVAGPGVASASSTTSRKRGMFAPQRHEEHKGPPYLCALWVFVVSCIGNTRSQARAIFRAGLLKQLGLLALCFAAGMTPWLYPLAQYARYGPFVGMDFGLPRHYFWGSPISWGAVFDLLTGGTLRRGIFQAPSLATALGTLRLVGERLRFEFGLLGLLAGILGCAVLLRRNRAAALGTAWVFLSILAYLMLLGPAVEDAPVFTLPMLLPWALWVALALDALGALLRSRWPATTARRWPALLVGALLIIATLAWGYSRLPYTNKHYLWLFRSFGETTLAALPPSAVLITHWEQGTTLQYLVLAERQRPDVLIDIVEPSDEDWSSRARRRYADRPVFFVGAASDVANLPVDLVRADPYADLFRLRK
jgi:hypothetical protein